MRKLLLLLLSCLIIGNVCGDFTPSGPYSDDGYTELLLHFDGTDGDTTTTDSSSNGHTFTFVDLAHIEEDDKKYGDTSLYGMSSTDYIYTADSDSWNFGSQDFVIEAWVNITSYAANGKVSMPIFTQWEDASNYQALYVVRNDSGNTHQITYYNRDTSGINMAIYSGYLTWATSTWYHVAFVRSGSDLYLYRDGTQVGSTGTAAGDADDFAAEMRIGRYRNDAYYIRGYIDELRVSKGTDRGWGGASTGSQVIFVNEM